MQTNNSYALQFDGNDDYLDAGNSSLFNFTSSNFTLECWIKPITIDHNDIIFSRGVLASDGWYLQFQNIAGVDRRIIFVSNQAGTAQAIRGNTSIPLGVWTHITFVREGTVGKIYVNGVEDSYYSQESLQDPATSTFNLFLMQDQIAELRPNAILDEVRIWNIARTQSEIQSTIFQRLNGDESGLIGYWPFEEGTGITTSDLTGNANTCNLINGPIWVSTSSLDYGLIAYYPFNGNANDESGNGNNGVVNGATLTTDKFGNASSAYSFDGISDYISLTDNTGLQFGTTDITVCTWVKTSQTSPGGRIMCRGECNGSQGWQFTTDNPGTVIGLNQGGGGATYFRSSKIINDDAWHFLVWSRRSGFIKIFVDGVANGDSGSFPQSLTNESSSLKIGKGDSPCDYPFQGLIDDIRIYNRALSQEEVENLYGNYGHRIISISDIPNDKGGKVRITWDKIYLDTTGQSPQITAYGVWRKIPAGMAVMKSAPSSMAIMNDTLGLLYDYLGTVYATQSPSYNFVAQTLYDSSGSGTNDEQYLITAHTSDPNVYFISETGTGHSVDNSTQFTVAAKWNIVSVPRSVPNYSVSALFPNSTSNAFAFDGAYVSTSTLSNGTAYWLKFSDNQEITVAGYFRESDTIQVMSGWNMIGSISSPVACTLIVSEPPGMVVSKFFGYGIGGYDDKTDTIQPGKGYWVKVAQAGKLILSSSTALSASNRIKIVPTSELPPSPPDEEVTNHQSQIPTHFALEQNYPNPFNPSTVISYSLPVHSFVTLKIYNTLGEEVATLAEEVQDAGYKSVEWNAEHIPSGMYFYRLQTSEFTQMKKLLLIK
ncbi:MAG: T9SS type A sorting domain-containing protein [Ignavibacteriae bacterium]|nr:T9SS type A sorting domain-containing protein [Ignavibacteriota bacterium]